MPQNQFGPSDTNTGIAKSPGIRVAGLGGIASRLNITTATVVKAVPGVAVRLIVTVAGSAPGSINDANSLASVAPATQIMPIPNTLGATSLEWPCLNGIVVTPGTGQTISLSFS